MKGIRKFYFPMPSRRCCLTFTNQNYPSAYSISKPITVVLAVPVGLPGPATHPAEAKYTPILHIRALYRQQITTRLLTVVHGSRQTPNAQCNQGQ